MTWEDLHPIEFSKSCPGRSSPPGMPFLAWSGVTLTAKRRRQSERAGALSLENFPQGGADALPPAEGHAETANGVSPAVSVLPGSKTSARSHMSFAREPGDLGSASS
jgi:hypothetical protein